MSLYYRSTVFPHTFISNSSVLLTGGVLYAYTAGTSTPEMMYSDSAGTNAGTSITLNARGEPEVSGNTIVIFLKKDVDYKFILKTADATTIWTADNVSYDGGIDDLWSLQSYAGTYLSATTFKLATGDGNKTADYHPGRNIRLNGNIYATVQKSNYNDTIANATYVLLRWVHDNTNTGTNVPSPITSIELGPEVNFPALNLKCLDAGKYGLVPSNGEPGYFDNATVLAKAISAANAENKTLVIPGIHAAGRMAYAYSGGLTITEDRMKIVGDGGPGASILLCMSTSGHAALTLDTAKHVWIDGIGIQGLSGGGHGFHFINTCDNFSLSNTWVGWVDGDAYRVTKAQSGSWVNTQVDINNGYRPCLIDASLTEGAVKNGIHVPLQVSGLSNDHVFTNLKINGSGQTYGTSSYGMIIGGVPGPGEPRVESITINGGLIQGMANYQGLYACMISSSINGLHIEPAVYINFGGAAGVAATGGTTTTITNASLVSGEWTQGDGYRVKIKSGTYAGSTGTITASTAGQITFTPALAGPILAGDLFQIQSLNSLTNYLVKLERCQNVAINSCGIQGDVQLIDSNQTNLNDCTIWGLFESGNNNCSINGGTYKNASDGVTQGAITRKSRRFTINNSKNAASDYGSLGLSMSNPVSFFQSNFEFWRGGASPTYPGSVTLTAAPTVAREKASGTATAGAATTLTDSTQTWTTNTHTGGTVIITGGTSGGSYGTIASNTGTVLTVDAWSAGTPDATSTYQIIGTTVTTGTYSAKVTYSADYTQGFTVHIPARYCLGKRVSIRAVCFVATGVAALYGIMDSVAQASTETDAAPMDRRVLEMTVDTLLKRSLNFRLTGSNGAVVFWDSVEIFIEDYVPLQFATIANAAIPDVSIGTNDNGPMIPTVLISGATSLTQITGMEYGKPLTCYFDGNKTITNGALLQLAGAANFSATANDVLVLMRSPVDDIIREVSRSVN